MLSSFANLQMPKYRLQYQFPQKIIHYIKVSLNITENRWRINKAIDKKEKEIQMANKALEKNIQP